MRARVWPGGDTQPIENGMVVLDAAGVITHLGSSVEAAGSVLAGVWAGPTLIDTHVHLCFGGPELALAGGVGAVRDLGAPTDVAQRWRRGSHPIVAVSGPIITAPGGYPEYSWGAGGFARFVAQASDAEAAVRRLMAEGVDVVKLALEPSAGYPVPSLEVAQAVVAAAHALDLSVVAHALTGAMVDRALAAGVDELAHVPIEPLTASLVRRIVDGGVVVSSTLTPHAQCGHTLANAAALIQAGARVVYGTDFGNADTRPGAEPSELEFLAEAGLGPCGALRAATEGAGQVAGLRGRVSGTLSVGQVASMVLLPADPLIEPVAWRSPVAVVQGPFMQDRDAGMIL